MKQLSIGISALLLAVGCQGAVDDGERQGNTSSGGSAAVGGQSGLTGGNVGTGNTGNTTSSGGAGNSSGAPPQISANCKEPKVGAPVLRLLTRNEFTNTINDIFPAIKGQWANGLPAEDVSALGFDNDSAAVVGNQRAAALLDTALAIGTAVTGAALPNLLNCASTANRACAEQFLNQYGKRLFRRPLSADEKTRYLTLFDSALAKSDFKTAIKYVTAGLIQSPNAVYRSEIGTDKGGTRQLTPYELASQLSYTYTGSTPSEELLTKAESGNLGDPVALARTLSQTEAGKQALHRFFEGYLGYGRVMATQKPAAKDFDAVSADMYKETRAFVQEVVFQKSGGLKELLTSTSTNPSQKLASFYGFPAPASDYAAVQRPAGKGVGILAQASFLATHSNSDASTPTQRGLFALRRVLCQTMPAAPPTVPKLGEATPGVKTTRQRYEDAHVKAGDSCNTCHQRFDPIGFGFEHFDEAGRYRENESGLPIDSSGSVLANEGGVLFSFKTQEELATKLAEQAVSYQCFSAYLATYAYGSPEACLGPSQAAALQAGTVGIAEAFVKLAAEPHFTSRRAF